ncbi:MAG: glycosyltransferase [Desulfatiglandales bacterium]
MPNVGIIIPSRVESSRLPGKCLEMIGGKTTLEICIENCKRANLPMVLAIPDNSADDVLVGLARKMGVSIYRGESLSPLHRMAKAAVKFNFKHVVRVTHDDILIDHVLLKKHIQWHLKQDADYTFCRMSPEGTAAELMRTTTLTKAADLAKDQNVEFVSYWMRQPGMKVEEYIPPQERQAKGIRLTMDYQEDLTLLKIVHSMLRPGFNTLDIINLFEQHPYLKDVNRMPEVTVYTCNYNQGLYAEDCVGSVAAQRGVDWEYHIIDDASSEFGAELFSGALTNAGLDENPKVKLTAIPVNKGLPFCSNLAIERARGKYIIRLDADDYFVDDFALAKMVEVLKANPNSGCVFSGFSKQDENGSLGRFDNAEEHPGCCMMVKRSAHDVRFREGLEHYEGLEFFKRFKRAYPTVHIPDILWVYRQHGKSKSKNRPLE